MSGGIELSLRLAAMSLIAFSLSAPKAGASLFTDDFDSGASPSWGNERGAWLSSGGVYFATLPNNIPPTYSSLPYTLSDLVLDVDVYNVSDGGIWLHSDATGNNGVLLVTGGHLHTGTGLYWHIVQNGSYGGILNEQSGLFVQGQAAIHLRVVVSGDTYAAYLNGSTTPATTLTTNAFPSGRVGLYDFTANQYFDNFALDGTPLGPHISVQPESRTACAGGMTDFTVVASGSGALSYEWRRTGMALANGPTGNGSTISGANTATLTISSVSTADTDAYSCTVSDSSGFTPSFAATLTVYPSGSADANGDGAVDGGDIQVFVDLLLQGGAPGTGYCAADMNHNGVVDVGDVSPFVIAVLTH